MIITKQSLACMECLLITRCFFLFVLLYKFSYLILTITLQKNKSVMIHILQMTK